MARRKFKTFTVGVGIRLWTEVEIEAESFEEALAKASKLDVKDVVDFDTPYNDGNIAIMSVNDNSVFDKIAG